MLIGQTVYDFRDQRRRGMLVNVTKQNAVVRKENGSLIHIKLAFTELANTGHFTKWKREEQSNASS